MKNNISAGLYHRISTYIGFFIVGSSVALWALSIPFIKLRLNINDLKLGSILMFLSIGALAAMMITDKLVSRFGCRRTFIFSVIVMIFSLYFINIMPGTLSLTAAVFILGAGVGIADVTANIQAVYMERAFNKKLMSGFHSMYSGGSFICGITASFLLTKSFNINTVINIMLIILFIFLIISFRGFAASGSMENTVKQDKKFTMPPLLLIIAGFICFAAYMTEGSMLDWAAILLIDYKDFPKEISGYGFSIFFASVTIGRLLGDYFANKFDTGKIIAVSAVTAVFGIACILIFNNKIILYTGFAVIGFGAANIIPMAVSAIPYVKGKISLNAAIAIVTTIGYTGSLMGPAVIGYISHLTNLITAFIFVCVLLILAGVFSLKLNRK